MAIVTIFLAALAAMVSTANATEGTTCVQVKGEKLCATLQFVQDSSLTHQRYTLTDLTENSYPVDRPNLLTGVGSFSAKDLCEAFGSVENLAAFSTHVPDRVLGIFGDAVQVRTEHHQANVMYSNGDCRLETLTFHYYDRVSCIAK